MTQADTASSQGSGGGLSNLVKFSLVTLAAIAVGLLIWFLPFGQTIISDSDKRNQRDLAIAASGLETWSDAVRTVAITNFIRGRVTAIENGDRDIADKWTHRARFRHPILGEYKVLYNVGSEADCSALANTISDREGTLPFVRSYLFGAGTMLKVIGNFAVADILRQDSQPFPRNMAANDVSPAAGPYVANILNTDTAKVPAVADLRVCYGAVIPLDRLLIIDRAAREFSNLLVLDSARRIVAQVGSEPIPLQSLDGLAPEGSVLVDTLKASVGQKQDQANKPKPIVDSLDPVDLHIAGKTMRAYVRPFHPARFPACAPAGQPATMASGECFVVGLMPKANVWRQIATPPLTLVFGLGLAIGIVVMLLPSLRLVLLGPREAIGKAEAIGIALGLPAAASLATLVVLFATDVTVHRHAADTTATRIATTAAEAGRKHLAAALAHAGTMARQLSVADPRSFGDGFRTLEAARLAVPQQPDPDVTAIAPFARACVDAALPRRADRAGRPPDYTPIGLQLAVNPRPLRCATAPICSDGTTRPDHPPLVESIGLYTNRGYAVPGTRTIACRSFFGGRSQLAGRNYFQRIITNDASQGDGGPPARPYAIEQVLSQPDGLNKTVVTFRADRLPAGYLPGDRQERVAYVVASTVITDLLNPAVLPPYQLMVVDTRDPSLPVIMHSAPNRAGAERLSMMLGGADAVRDSLRALVAHGKDVARFSRFYDGADREFVAAPIPGSRWVVIVHYATNAIDAQSARTARHALIDWASMSLLFGIGWVIWLAVVGKHGWADERRLDRSGLLAPLFERGWPRLWPQQARRDDYIKLRRWLLVGAGVAALVILAVDASGIWSVIAFVAAMLLRVGAGVALHWQLGRPEPVVEDRALGPDTQAAFIKLAVALCLCLSVLPMLAFWADGHRLGRIEQRQALLHALDGHDGEIERADRGLEGIFWSFGYAPGARHRHATAYGFERGRDANDGAGTAVATIAAEAPDTTFAGTLNEIAGRGSDTIAIPGCAATAVPRLCGPPGNQRGIGLPEPGLGNLDATSATALLILAGLLVFGWRFIVKRVLRDLCGFGIALEAVKYPMVDLKSLWVRPTQTDEEMAAAGTQTLNRKSLLVNAPWSLLTMLDRLCKQHQTPVRRIEIFDVSGLQAGNPVLRQPIVATGKIILVVGLDLVLADTGRRLLALAAIEKLVRDIDAATTEALDDPYLLFLSPSAPMDRILDAYEREHPEAANPDAARENLRWARVFEDFASFQFRPIELTDGVIPALSTTITDPVALATIDKALANPNGKKAIRTVFEELRWLSPRVVNGCINEERYPRPALLDCGMLPIVDPAAPGRSPFIALYNDIVLIWAAARRFPGRNAALSYIRGQFIEHYQRLWSASTVAERLVMHHIAFGRFVNIRSSLGFAPLVRRGLVVLDPEPRLMNESFAMFVRQAEKLDRIREWQQALPGSAWLKSRLPIFLLLGLGVLALAAMAILAGQDIVALLPVLAAGAPALLAVTQRLLRPAGS